jgi:hypothetical protein
LVPFVAILYRSSGWDGRVRDIAVLAAGPLLLAAWFYIKSIAQWGEVYPAGEIGHANPVPLDSDVYRYLFFPSLRESYWYAGGWLRIRMAPIIYDTLNLAFAVSIGGLIALWVSARLTQAQRVGIAVLCVLPLLAVAAILYYCSEYDYQPQGRYLFIAQPAIGILVAAGASAFSGVTRGPWRFSIYAVPALLLLVNFQVLTRYLPDAY